MKQYEVYLNEDAEHDILVSYEWGVRTWGQHAAEKWVREIYKAIFGRLTKFPESCPLAPENDDVEKETRQLLIGRYRILYIIRETEVIVVHLRGPFAG